MNRLTACDDEFLSVAVCLISASLRLGAIHSASTYGQATVSLVCDLVAMRLQYLS